MRRRLAISAFLGLAAANVPAVPMHAAPQTQCTGPLGREFKDAAVSGVELVPGLFSGMSREEVERAAPDLAGRRVRVELLPGLSYRAEPNFARWRTEWLSGIEIKGPIQKDPTEALSKRYGRPEEISAGAHLLPPISDNLPRLTLIPFESMKWCDRGRLLVLHRNPDGFTLTITTIARRKRDPARD